MNQPLYDLVIQNQEYLGFKNKECFLIEIDEVFTQSKRVQDNFSIVLFKIDYFEKLKTTFDLQELLRFLHEFLSQVPQNIRKNDRKFYIEEDSFVLILPTAIDHACCYPVVKRIEHILSEQVLKSEKYQEKLTLSFGFSSYNYGLSHFMELYDNAKLDLSRRMKEKNKQY